MKNNKVFLIGNPNSGKTSLFNAITGERLHVGNWPGVTVQKIEGVIRTPEKCTVLTDLPGTYSLSPATPEEKVVLESIDEASKGKILNVVDISNFERNLLLTTQLVELGLKPILSLNCYDLFTKNGGSINLQRFGALTQLNAYPTVARTGTGINALIDCLISEEKEPSRCKNPSSLDFSEKWKTVLIKCAKSFNIDWAEASPLKKHEILSKFISTSDNNLSEELIKIRNDFAQEISEESKRTIKPTNLACELAMDRYSRIEKLLAATATVPEKNLPKWQEKLDSLLTHRIMGLPMFLALMIFVFWTTFSLAEAPMSWIESGIDFLANFAESKLSEGLLSDLIVNGIIHGVGGVLVFVPNILILFFWIALLEDSGYMSRAAFMMDRLMKAIGLQGRAFIPMIMGLGCNVPAIMATRIIDSKFQRFLTILLIPLVSCAARLPVLVLLCGTFFPNNPSLWMFLLFSVNIGVIILLGHFSNLMFKAVENSPFLLEMPPYRLPTFKSVLDTLKEKAWHFIEKAGTVILAGTIIIWVLSSFPRDIPLSFDYEAEKALIMSVKDETKKQEALESLDSKRELEYMENRYMAKLGKAIHPIMEPLGFTWRETVSLIPGFLAKESVVSTLTVLYLPFSSDLGEAMTKSGITPLSAFVFMLFTLLYIPCLATFGVMWRESGSLKFTASSLFIYFIIAYLASFIALKVGELMQTADGIALENILIVICSIIAAWYLINITISSISGKMCNSCSACSGCPSKTENCKGGCHK